MKILFNELPILPQTKEALEILGFHEATPIQALAIPKMIEGADFIGQAQTGTGKTFAFGIPILEKIKVQNKAIQALILTPTRELALQVYKEILKLVKFYHEVKVASIVGGESYEKQFTALKKHPHIIVATPGRIIDHIDRNTVDLSNLTVLTLDEADEMLKMGFQEDIEKILQTTPSSRQTVLFSATMPPFIKKIAKNYQKDSTIIKVEEKTLTVEKITQAYFVVKEEDKPKLLSRILDYEQPTSAIIFANTKKDVDTISATLQEAKFTADALHGDLKQSQRNYVMSRFRNKQLSLLVATDVAARGLDVSDVEVVINYDVPQQLEVYVHRVGRTGRAGKKGKAFSFITPRKRRVILDLENFTKQVIKKGEIPTETDIRKKQLSRFSNRLKHLVKETQTNHELIIENLLSDEITKDHLLNALIDALIPQEKTYEPIDVILEKSKSNKDQRLNKKSSGHLELPKRSGNYQKYTINLGRKDQINPAILLEFFNKELKIFPKNIGDIKHLNNETIFEINKENVKRLESKSKIMYKGRIIKIKPYVQS